LVNLDPAQRLRHTMQAPTFENSSKAPILQRTLEGHRKPVTSIAFSPIHSQSAFSSHTKQIQQILASGSVDGTLTLWSFDYLQSNDDKLKRNAKRSDDIRAYRLVKTFL